MWRNGGRNFLRCATYAIEFVDICPQVTAAKVACEQLNSGGSSPSTASFWACHARPGEDRIERVSRCCTCARCGTNTYLSIRPHQDAICSHWSCAVRKDLQKRPPDANCGCAVPPAGPVDRKIHGCGRRFEVRRGRVAQQHRNPCQSRTGWRGGGDAGLLRQLLCPPKAI